MQSFSPQRNWWSRAAVSFPQVLRSGLGPADELDELVVALELAELRRELLHGVDVVHRT